MNYYLLNADSKAQEIPQIVNWFEKLDISLMTPECYHKIPKVTVLQANMAPNVQYKEVIIKPFLLLPKDAGKILKAFELWMEFRDVVLVNRTKMENHKYVFPLLQKYDCLAEDSKLNTDKTVLEKGILKKNAIPDQVLFMPEHVNGRFIIAREDFIEALLQNNYFGYTIQKLEVRD